MDVLVMGAGGVGGYFGALLARAGHTLRVVARGSHLEAMRSDGLRIVTAIEDDFVVPVQASNSPDSGGTADLILFTVKSYDAYDAIDSIRTAVGPQTVILTLLNGVHSGDLLAESFGRDRVLDGIVYIESHVKAPGIVAQEGGPRKVVFGRRQGNEKRDRSLLAEFQNAGWNVELSEEILTPMWQKLTFIGPFAAFNTVTGLKGEVLCSQEECERLIHSMMTEYVTVGRAEGADLPPDCADIALARLRGFAGLSSMLRDRIAGKRLEADALVGQVIQRAKAHDLPTPTTSSLYSLLTPMASGGATKLG